MCMRTDTNTHTYSQQLQSEVSVIVILFDLCIWILISKGPSKFILTADKLFIRTNKKFRNTFPEDKFLGGMIYFVTPVSQENLSPMKLCRGDSFSKSLPINVSDRIS